jgi:hypothetical protein
MWKKTTILFIIFALLLMGASVPKANAVKKMYMEMSPNFTGTNAEYRFCFTIQKKLEYGQWIQLKFPKEIVFPSEKPDIPRPNPHCPDPYADALWDMENKTIRLAINMELNPAIEGYQDIQVTIPTSFHICNPEKSGSYVFAVRTEAEPDWVNSEPFEIVEGVPSAKMVSCLFKDGLDTVRIEEETYAWSRKITLQTALLPSSLTPEDTFYIHINDLKADIFDFSFRQWSSDSTENFEFKNHANHRLQFSLNSLDDKKIFSNPIFDGEEKKWNHPPVLNENEIYIDIYELAFFFGYKMQKEENQPVVIKNTKGRSFTIYPSTRQIHIKQATMYAYHYQLGHPTTYINTKFRVDLNFVIYKYLETVTWEKNEFEPHQWQIKCTGLDRYQKTWEFTFYRDTTPGKEHYKDVVLLNIHGKQVVWNTIVLDPLEEISPHVVNAQFLVPIVDFFKAVPLHIEEREDDKEVLVHF